MILLDQGAAREKIFIKARDGYDLDIRIFKAKNAKAVVQVIHGMEEHQERYAAFAEFLNQHDLSVVSSNMRGHGSTAEHLGYFKDRKGYLELVEDQKAITDFIKKRFPRLPIYIFAHSMGTIITRVLLQRDSCSYEKAALSGYPNYQRGAGFGILLADIIKAFRGPKYKSGLIRSLSIGSFNKRIKNPKTDSDWICYNEETVQNYIEDPYCGFGFTCSAYSDLFHLVIMMHKPKLYKNVNQEMALLLLRGKDDPCTGGDRGAEDSRRILSKAGFQHIRCIDYPDMRHEILAETDHKKVYDDVLAFFKTI